MGTAFMSVEEGAQIAGVSTATLYRMVARGEIPSRRFGRALRLPRRAFLEAMGLEPGDLF